MLFPSFSEFKKLSRAGDTIPVHSEFLADLETPVTLFLRVAAKEKQAFLLESTEIGEKMGRYSFIGMNPRLTVELSRGTLTYHSHGRKRRIKLRTKNDVFTHLRNLLADARYVPSKSLPPFVGGLVGYLGYEFVQYCDKVTFRKKPALGTPDALLFLVDSMLIFDHFKHTIQLVHLAQGASKNPRLAYRRAQHILKRLERTIKRRGTFGKPLSAPEPASRFDKKGVKSVPNLTKAQFEKKVNQIKAYIRAGDCIQAVMSQRFKLAPLRDDFAVYRSLRSLNPSPYMFYFKHGQLRLIGSSPEMLVRHQQGIAETKPIAGTRPRGETEERDRQLEANLRNSKKELAEHLMLVDLGRNDLGRVCRANSVHVGSFAHVERYSHVMHLVSDVKGVLMKGEDSFDLLKAAFPAGTLSGAPKIRAIEIIDELEEEARGPYGGAVGYFSFNGDMDLCIVIRTIIIQKGIPYVQAGAGIVYDSNPGREYTETLNKTGVLFQAIRSARHQARGTR